MQNLSIFLQFSKFLTFLRHCSFNLFIHNVQNDQTHLKNVATFTPRFLNRFATLSGIYLFWYESVSSKSAEQKIKKLVCCCGCCVRLFKNSNHQLLLKRIVCHILQNLIFIMCSSHLVDQELLMSEKFSKISYKKKGLHIFSVSIIFLIYIYIIITL